MEISILFMITCIITARFLEKRKMNVAVVFYSIMFITVSAFLLLSAEIPIIQRAFENIFGDERYKLIHEVALESMSMTYYGISIAGILVFTVAVQIVIALMEAASAAVRCIKAFANSETVHRFKKAYIKHASLVRSLFIPKRINLIYCRMLN